MARRTKEELLAELRRLGGMWDVLRDYEIESRPPEERTERAQVLPRSEDHIARFRAEGASLSALISGFREPLNETNLMLRQGGGNDFLAFYLERTGRDWWEDAEDPIREARAILRRGRIRNETEWYLLESILVDVDQTIFSANETEKLETMRAAFTP